MEYELAFRDFDLLALRSTAYGNTDALLSALKIVVLYLRYMRKTSIVTRRLKRSIVSTVHFERGYKFDLNTI